jgi:nucleoid-associated protein YgaU
VAASIGIKIANGDFYPILDENSQAKKRLVLTTVHDGQRSTQIDLYRSATRSMADAQPIGSLVVEKIKARKKGEPSVELLISFNADGDVFAEAKDLDNPQSGEGAQLSVSLKTLQGSVPDIPDFDLESQDGFDDGGMDDYPAASPETTRWDAKRKIPVLPIAAAAVILLVALFAVWIFAFGGKALLTGGNKAAASEIIIAEIPAPPVVQTPPPAVQTPPPVVQTPPPPVVETPPPVAPPPPPAPPPLVRPKEAPAAAIAVSRQRPTPPVRSYKVPAVIPKGGVRYRIRWGDTLWDISQAFYRNPYRYAYLARWNGIKNPNRIISGTTITIPPR